MLHIIYQSPSESQALENCLAVCKSEDAILLIENGVFCALRDSVSGNQLLNCTAKIFILAPHAAERDIRLRLINNIHLIDFEGFVDLTVEYYPILRW